MHAVCIGYLNKKSISHKSNIDATNLNEKTLQKWKAIAAKYEADIEYVKVDTPLEECLRRNKNADREHVIPDDVIKDFYKRFKQLS